MTDNEYVKFEVRHHGDNPKTIIGYCLLCGGVEVTGWCYDVDYVVTRIIVHLFDEHDIRVTNK